MFSRTLQLYQAGGFQSVLSGIIRYSLLTFPGKLILLIFGKRVHQKLYMRFSVGYWPQIRNPRTFNEKLCHRKLYTDNARFSTVEDKWAVRDYVANQVGEKYLPKVYHVTDDLDTIAFDSLPDEYVIKPTHLSGPIIIVNRGESPERDIILQNCSDWLGRTHGTMRCEYWYQNIDPKILIEERLYGSESDVPRDFKFFVFHNEVKYVQVDFDRYTNHTRRFYDRDWNSLDFEVNYPLGPEAKKPDRLEEMIEIAEELGNDFEFIRVDLYKTDNSGIVFGELTVAPGSGTEQFRPIEKDFEFGSLW